MKFLLKAKWTWPGNPFLPENPDFKTGQRHASNLSPNLPTKIVFHIFWCMLEILGLEFDLTVVSISRLHCHAIKKFNSWPARTCKLETEVHSDAMIYSFQYIPETVWTRTIFLWIYILAKCKLALGLNLPISLKMAIDLEPLITSQWFDLEELQWGREDL